MLMLPTTYRPNYYIFCVAVSTRDDNKSFRSTSSDSAFMINKYFNSFPASSSTGISKCDNPDMEIQNSPIVQVTPALKDKRDMMIRDQEVQPHLSLSVNSKNTDGESVVLYESSGSEYFPSDIETEADEDDDRVENNVLNQKKKKKLSNTKDSHRTIAEKTNFHKVVVSTSVSEESKKSEACDRENKTTESGEIYIRSSSKTSDGKRKRNKVYCCLYCNKMLKELSKHLEKKHKDESEVQKLMAKPKKDASRRQGFIHLAKVGNYYHNCKVLKQRSGELILARVPTEEEKKMHTYSDYGPCPDCLAFMLKRHLWHHLAQSCAVKSNSGLRRRPLLECNTLLAHTYSELHPSPDFNQYIISAFKTDDISLICKQDILIIKFGEMQFDKYHTTQAELIRQCMRQLARLVKELREVDKPKLWLSEWLNPAGFDIIVSAVKKLCKVECMRKARPTYTTPSLALKIGYHLRKCIAISKAQCLRREDTNAIQTLNNFQSLMDMEWTSKISSNALRTLFDRKINAVELLPITEDLLKLNKHLNSHLQMCKEALEQSENYLTWRNLARIVLCKIVLFNKRRSGEISRMTVTNYSSRPNWSQQTASEFQKTFTDLEKQLFNRLAIVQIKGKRGNLPEIENEAEGSDCEYAEKEDEKELDDIAEDVAHTSITKSKNWSNPKVLKKKTPVRRCWSDKESAAVLQFFRTSIKKGT
ncbi:hypothetical protein RN001_015014 [Aquatica leii]|uniref:Uncharacterized protein n=1 Tax=Aquatica leii TaxID=1421715 RepID=A0AAN7SNC8_9COLE|nr:hypothetical protein RN001_015014 [Aquatica leii]